MSSMLLKNSKPQSEKPTREPVAQIYSGAWRLEASKRRRYLASFVSVLMKHAAKFHETGDGLGQA